MIQRREIPKTPQNHLAFFEGAHYSRGCKEKEERVQRKKGKEELS